jgi:hypothetical protein
VTAGWKNVTSLRTPNGMVTGGNLKPEVINEFNAFIINWLNFSLMSSLWCFKLNESRPLDVAVSKITLSHIYTGTQLGGWVVQLDQTVELKGWLCTQQF